LFKLLVGSFVAQIGAFIVGLFSIHLLPPVAGDLTLGRSHFGHSIYYTHGTCCQSRKSKRSCLDSGRCAVMAFKYNTYAVAHVRDCGFYFDRHYLNATN
jgi:hypothetical protein